MNLTLLLEGIILGFSIAAPVGPIGVLCIRRPLAHGRLTGFCRVWAQQQRMRVVGRRRHWAFIWHLQVRRTRRPRRTRFCGL